MKRWKKYAVILEKDCQIFLKRSSLLSASRFEKDVRKDQGGRFLGRKDEKISKADRSTFLKGHPLPLPNSTIECDGCAKDR
ncbi:hypothetical protein DBT36_04825 [Aerococcus mictus]|nr:hypothetical protein CYJ31_00215 [Aerococcus mictus]PMB93835.1 hypothetical protein CK795_00215 [Aerococcus mictus]RAV64588.1 hypothetical protein DBT35_03440 [Aerococcus mictus]RAV72026.1 hypothetical protein DBT47_04895 [Aerococcus mictus]RAV85828.1 hypothetical protein DBT36_04825 [Aerococcus mictus]